MCELALKHVACAPCRTSKQRSKENWRAKKKGIETELLNIYDLSTKTWRPAPIAKSFGGVNIYTDITNGINSQHVEAKLSRLENEAAQVIATLQDACGRGTFVLTRRALEVLRKFVYVMHFRKPSTRDMYFNTGPEDPLSDWLQQYKETHNIKTPEDMWLHALAYILDTPHPIIIAEGEKMHAKYEDRMMMMLSTKLDPNFENWFATDYRSLQNAYFIGVWEAAQECEFVLGNNSFGLWEGLLKTGMDIHRIFVISPRLALVLRTNTFQIYGKEALSLVDRSALAEVPMQGASIKYHGHPGDFASEEDLQRYRATPAAQKDVFTYKITKLTEAKTREVNEAILHNVEQDESIVFSSKECMLKTIHYHITSPELGIQLCDPHGRYAALYHALLRSLKSPEDLAAESDHDFRLRVVLEVMRRRMVRFRSRWDATHWCYRAMTADPNQMHPLAIDVRLRLAQMINVMKARGKHESPRRNPSARLADSLSEDSNRVMMPMCMAVAGLMGDKFARSLKGEDLSAMVGFIEWPVKERMDFIKPLIGADMYRRLTLT